MPLSDEYRRERVEWFQRYEREASRDTMRAWFRAAGEIILWTLAGLGCLGFALHTFDFQLGRVVWWMGCVLWIGGVSAAVLSAYRRGQERGDW